MTLAFVDMPGARPWPPRVSAFTKPFWDALAEGRLITTKGKTSGRMTFPPKPFCPYDWGREVSGSAYLVAERSIRKPSSMQRRRHLPEKRRSTTAS